jgi:hypothetical protein
MPREEFKQEVVLHSTEQETERKRHPEAVLTVDYVNEASSEARFQGRRSPMRLMG